MTDVGRLALNLQQMCLLPLMLEEIGSGTVPFQMDKCLPFWQQTTGKPFACSSMGANIDNPSVTATDEHHATVALVPTPVVQQSFLAEKKTCRPKSVHFSDVSVRDYDRIIGDHPDVRHGVPMAIGWEYIEREATNIDEYENNRPHPFRGEKQMKMKPSLRRKILSKGFGFTKEEILTAERNSRRCHIRKVKQEARRKLVRQIMRTILLPKHSIRRAQGGI